MPSSGSRASTGWRSRCRASRSKQNKRSRQCLEITNKNGRRRVALFGVRRRFVRRFVSAAVGSGDGHDVFAFRVRIVRRVVFAAGLGSRLHDDVGGRREFLDHSTKRRLFAVEFLRRRVHHLSGVLLLLDVSVEKDVGGRTIALDVFGGRMRRRVHRRLELGVLGRRRSGVGVEETGSVVRIQFRARIRRAFYDQATKQNRGVCDVRTRNDLFHRVDRRVRMVSIRRHGRHRRARSRLHGVRVLTMVRAAVSGRVNPRVHPTTSIESGS